jgi:hypothetical protein
MRPHGGHCIGSLPREETPKDFGLASFALGHRTAERLRLIERLAHCRKIAGELHGSCFRQMGKRKGGIFRQRAIEGRGRPGASCHQQIDTFCIGITCRRGLSSNGKAIAIG